MAIKTATNPQTGERIALIDGQWQKYEKTATGKNGEKAFLVGGAWIVDKPAVAEVTNKKKIYEQVADEAPWYENLAAGLGGGMYGMGLGVKDILGLASDDEVAEYQNAMSGLRGTVGGVVGEIGSYLVPGTALMKGAAKIPTVGRLMAAGGRRAAGAVSATGAGIGAIEGALMPTTGDQSRVQNMLISGGIGAAAPLAVGGVTAAAQKVRSGVAPFFSKSARETAAGGMMRDVAGQKADEVIAALRNSRPVVSGQSVGEATVGVQVPELAGLQKVASSVNPSAAYPAELAKRGARENLIRSFAGTADDVAQATETRGSVMQRMMADSEADLAAKRAGFEASVRPERVVVERGRGIMGEEVIKGNKTIPAPEFALEAIDSLKSNPVMKAAIADARRMAANKTGLPDTAQGFKNWDADVIADVIADPTKSVQGLQLIKFVIDEQFKNPNAINTALSAFDNASLASVKRAYTAALEKSSSKFAEANAEFARRSGDINQMTIGQEALRRLSRPIGDKETAVAYARSLADEAALAKAGNKGQELAAQLRPENMAKLQRVAKELDINASFEEAAARGMQGDVLKSAVGSVVELPNMLNTSIVLTNNFLRRVSGGGKIKTLKDLAEIMQDPARAARLMEAASTKEKNAIKFLVRAQQVGAIGGISTGKVAQQ